MIIAVGFLISYDYALLKYSLPLVYSFVDKVVLAVDKDNLTYTGQKINIDSSFFEWIELFDTDNKISWLKESFYNPSFTPMQNETAERNSLAKAMAPADWYVQIDVDEYFINLKGFADFLKKYQSKTELPCSFLVRWKTIYKKVNGGYLVIAGREEEITIATNTPYYLEGRNNSTIKNVKGNFILLHQSWARSEAEIKTKVDNWSHANDFDTTAFYNRWLSCNHFNYKSFINFHPIHHLLWPRLEWVRADSVAELISHYTLHPPGPEIPNRKPLLERMKARAKKLLPGF